MRSPSVPASSSSAASDDTLKKYFSVGWLAIPLISLIKFLVSSSFLIKYPKTLCKETNKQRNKKRDHGAIPFPSVLF